MTKISTTKDTRKICNYNKLVFGEYIDEAYIKSYMVKKNYDSEPIYFLLEKDEKEIGYAVCFTKRDIGFFTIWLIGILAEYRNNGFGDYFYKQIENYARDESFLDLEIITYNKRRNMLSILINNDYIITNTFYSTKRNDKKIIFHKSLNIKKEIRISLTTRCNFKCFFCHGEGLAGTNRRLEIDKDKNMQLIYELLRNNYTDITFTGGEPLIEKNTFIYILDKLNDLDEKPSITLVTNGYFLNDDIIQKIKDYKGNIKINYSFHYTVFDDFKKITGQNESVFLKTKENLIKVAQSGISLKVNTVILRNINNSELSLKNHISFLESIGVKNLKYLELLITKENKNLFDHYYEINPVEDGIRKIATLFKSEIRRNVYKLNTNNDFKIELQLLTCRFGCSNCNIIRDRTIDTQLNYYPCFVQGNNPIKIENVNLLQEYFIKGDRVINASAIKYGAGSPLLTMVEKYVESEYETYFYFHSKTIEHVLNVFKQKGLELKSKKSFYLESYVPTIFNDEYETYKRVLETGWEKYNENKVYLIYMDNEFTYKDNKLFIQKHFLDREGPFIFSKRDYETKIRPLISNMGFKKKFSYDYTIDIYKTKFYAVSLCKVGQYYSIKITNYDNYKEFYDDLISNIGAEPILEHHSSFVTKNMQ